MEATIRPRWCVSIRSERTRPARCRRCALTNRLSGWLRRHCAGTPSCHPSNIASSFPGSRQRRCQHQIPRRRHRRRPWSRLRRRIRPHRILPAKFHRNAILPPSNLPWRRRSLRSRNESNTPRTARRFPFPTYIACDGRVASPTLIDNIVFARCRHHLTLQFQAHDDFIANAEKWIHPDTGQHEFPSGVEISEHRIQDRAYPQ